MKQGLVYKKEILAGKIWEDGHIGWHTQFNQKFAQLIVRECVSVMYEDDGATHHCELLFTHFGVEE
jgi:predicted flavoprotein YhiN